MKKAVLVVLGTRPEVIKLAPVIAALQALSGEGIRTRVCSTGQHREMLAPVLNLFGIRVDHDLDIMQKNQPPATTLGRALQGLDPVLRQEQPDHVVVQGDTTTSLAGAIAGFYQAVPVCHVEAGLRTRDLDAPFPEEANRQMISRICHLHFAPTQSNRLALIHEGVDPARIHVTGNPVIDALKQLQKRWEVTPAEQYELEEELQGHLGQVGSRPFILVTGHRRENMGEGFRNLGRALNDIAIRYPELVLLIPLHLNPAVRSDLGQTLEQRENIRLCSPLSYSSFVYAMSRSQLVLTDSGGVQEEAPAFGKPVLVMRESTERQEAVEAGTVRLVGNRPAQILSEVSRLLEQPLHYQNMARATNPYGDGQAAQRIAQLIRSSLAPVAVPGV